MFTGPYQFSLFAVPALLILSTACNQAVPAPPATVAPAKPGEASTTTVSSPSPIAAAIIGGTSLAGGRGRILGALLGALLMGSLNNGMSLMNVPTFYQDTARGIVLLLAVAIDQFSRRRSTAR